MSIFQKPVFFTRLSVMSSLNREIGGIFKKSIVNKTCLMFVSIHICDLCQVPLWIYVRSCTQNSGWNWDENMYTKCESILVLIWHFGFCLKLKKKNLRLAVVVAVDRPALAAAKPAGQDADVGAPKSCVAEGIQHGVDSWIDVAEIVGNLPQRVRDVYSRQLFAQQTIQDGQDAVGQPCQNERQQNGAQRFGRLALLFFLRALLFVMLLSDPLGQRVRRGHGVGRVRQRSMALGFDERPRHKLGVQRQLAYLINFWPALTSGRGRCGFGHANRVRVWRHAHAQLVRRAQSARSAHWPISLGLRHQLLNRRSGGLDQLVVLVQRWIVIGGGAVHMSATPSSPLWRGRELDEYRVNRLRVHRRIVTAHTSIDRRLGRGHRVRGCIVATPTSRPRCPAAAAGYFRYLLSALLFAHSQWAGLLVTPMGVRIPDLVDGGTFLNWRFQAAGRGVTFTRGLVANVSTWV